MSKQKKDVSVDEFLELDSSSLASLENKEEKATEAIDVKDLEQMQDIEDIEDDSLKFKLEQFEGPLDLLYHLIKQAKIDIRDIFISEITEQYLEMMQDLDSIDMDKAADFTLMAATLLEIKSKQLLPKPEIVEYFEDAEDPEEQLYRQLEEYKLFKEASEKLKVIEDVGKFYKEPEPTAGDFRYVLPDQLSLDALITAFSKMMHRVSVKAEAVEERKIEKDRFTVAEKIAQIKDSLLIKKQFKFSELFEDDYSKSEIINTFLALLELLKSQLITVSQQSAFADIDIFKREENNG